MMDIKSKIKKYVASTAAALGVAATAGAQVNYVDIADVELDGAALDSFNIDINGDSINDLLFYNNRTINTTGTNTNVASSAWTQEIMQAITGQAFFDVNNGGFNGSTSSGSYSIDRLDLGDRIAIGAFAIYDNILLGSANGTKTISKAGTGSVIGSNSTYSADTDNVSGSFGNWVPNANDTITAYVGFQFDASGESHNGWVRIQVYDYMKIKILDYAYDKCASTNFKAGYKFGDNSCGVIAQGSSCSDAVPLKCGDFLKGTTIGGIAYPGDCGLDTITTYPTAWYSFVGDGAPIIVDVRIRNGTATNKWDPNLRIYEGDDCGNLTCVTGNEQGFSSINARVEFTTVEEKQYYAVVGSNGKFPAWTDTTVGDFDISLEGGCNFYALQEVTGECGEALVNGKSYYNDTTISVAMKDVQDSLVFDLTTNVYEYINAKITFNGPAVNTEVVKNGLDLTASQDSATYQWLDCDNNNSPIAGDTNQSFAALNDGNYAVEITNDQGCVDTSQCVTILTDGLAELNAVGISIFPNPTENDINISFEETQESVNVEIINLIGEVVQRSFYQNTNFVHASMDLSSGMYIVRITNDIGLNKSLNIIKK